jgi:hypothetical protein
MNNLKKKKNDDDGISVLLTNKQTRQKQTAKFRDFCVLCAVLLCFNYLFVQVGLVMAVTRIGEFF